MRLSDKYPFLTKYFTDAISSSVRPMPQSILFYGNDFESQYILAKEIGRLLNCKEDKADDCECLNCKWINEDTHPAIMTISRIDNKPEDDESKTVISIKQSQLIKELLMSSSEFHRVFIFCGRDEDGNISGLNSMNFQAETSNSLLKIIEEPQTDVTFIFITRYLDDVLPTILSRSQAFFVPSVNAADYDYSIIKGVFTNYFEFDRKDVFDISQKLQDLAKNNTDSAVIQSIQNYVLELLKINPHNTKFLKHIKYVEDAKKQSKLGMKSVNIFDDLCLKLIS